MDASSVTRALSFSEHDQAGGALEVESNTGDSNENMPSCEDLMMEMESSGEILTMVELNLSRSYEKSLNLENLAMHVETRESDLETFVSEMEQAACDSAQGAMEFDLLSGILESELNELEKYLLNLQSKVVLACEMMSPSKYCGEAFKEIHDKLSYSEESLMQTLEQISHLRVQSNKFNRMVLVSAGDGKVNKDTENGYYTDVNSKIQMQTAEQRKHVLTMFGKSLARELDLEKMLSEAKQSEEYLKFRQQQEILCMEEEAEITWAKLFEAENAFEILMGMSKELMNKQRMVRFNFNASIQREQELKTKCKDLNEQLKVKNSNACEMQSSINQLREKVAKTEQKAASVEAECKCLCETNTKLNEELNVVKSDEESASQKASLLEKKLRDRDIQLQHAVASVEASQEKQTILQSMVNDMEALINDLKAKAIRAERQITSSEEKCIVLLESNSNLNEELNFLRSRMETLEVSLHLIEETKKETVIDISVQTKLINNLIMQLSSERERLHNQVSALTSEKKILTKLLLQQRTKGTKLVNDLSSKSSVRVVKGEAVNLTHTRNEVYADLTRGVNDPIRAFTYRVEQPSQNNEARDQSTRGKVACSWFDIILIMLEISSIMLDKNIVLSNLNSSFE